MKKILFIVFAALLIVPAASFAQGCMDGGSDEGVNIAGFIQPQFEFAQDKSENMASFAFERARFGFYGNIPYDISYYAFIETSAFKADKPYLLDAFVTYNRFGPFAKVSIGQFKSPFSVELNTPCQSLHTVKRSKVVRELASPDRDLGLMFSGGNDTTLIRYSAAITNGRGIDTLDLNRNKDVIGRLVFQPFDFLSIGGSFLYGKTKEDKEDDNRMRYAGELQVKHKNFLFQSEYIYGEDNGTYTTGGGCGEPLVVHEGSAKRSGFFAQAMYMTKWNLQPVIKYEYYDPNLDLDKNDADFATSMSYQSTITFGVNYFLNEWTRLQVNYLYNAEEHEILNDMFYFQVQAKF